MIANLSEASKDFSVEIIRLCNSLKKEHHQGVLANQLIRSGTSIGANVHESKYAYSPADFVFKMQIALKECYESEYWLEILMRSDLITETEFKRLRSNCGAIRRMLISSINTTKKKYSLPNTEPKSL